MKLKEFFKGVGGDRKATNIGTNRFSLTLDKEELKTPHFVMEKVEDMLSNRASLANGLRQLTLFVMPDLHFTSSDEKSSVFANEWLSMRDDLERELFKFVYLFLGGGNSYLEPKYKKLKNGGKVLDMLYHKATPSKVYLNLKAKSDDEYWIIEYPTEVFSIEGKTLKYYPITYVYGSYTWRTNTWGIAIHKDELLQAKFLWNSSPYYGSGLLSAAIDNENVAEEILKNWALAAKYRSLSKKIIGFYNEDGESVDPSELDAIQDQFDSMEEEDSLLVNKKFVSEDLTFNGADNMMQQEIEFLRKDSGASLTPNYMSAFSQDSSMATAAEAKVPFSLSIDSTQKMIEGFLHNVITENLLSAYPFLSDDLELKLGKAELYSRNENFMNISTLYNSRAATFNELRTAAGLEPVEGGDVWGDAPPLDNLRVSNTDSTISESLKKKKALKEKYKTELKEIFKPAIKQIERIEIKKPEEKDDKKSFKEAVVEILK